MNEQKVAVTGEKDVRVLDTAKKELGNEVSIIEKEAADLVINNDGDFQSASDILRQNKTLQKKVTDYWEPMRKSAKQAYDDVLAHKNEMLDPLKAAEKIIKKKIGDYTLKKQEEQRRREAEMRRLAQEEADRKLAEAIKCQDSGDEFGAEAAMAEAEVMDDMALSNISVPTQKPKADGVSMSKTWKIASIDDSKVPIDLNGAVLRPVDKSAVMALIKATKGTIKIPGVVYEESVSVSVRSK